MTCSPLLISANRMAPRALPASRGRFRCSTQPLGFRPCMPPWHRRFLMLQGLAPLPRRRPRPASAMTDSLKLSIRGLGSESAEYEVVQATRPGFPVGSRIDFPQASQGKDDIVGIKSGAHVASLLGGG